MKVSRVILSLFTIFIMIFLTNHTALAAENLIKSHNTVVPENQQVENLVVLGSDATINGTVKVATIVINGNLKINHTAKIKGPVIVIGGHITQEKGAIVTEQIISLNLNDETQNSFILSAILLASEWLLKLSGSIILIVFTILIGLLLKRRMDKLTSLISYQPGKMLVIGAISSIALAAITLLLILTIIGIPIAILLLVVLLLTFVLGAVIVSKEVATYIKGMSEKPYWLQLLVGSVIVTSLLNFPLIGIIVLLCIFWISLGFIIKWLFDANRKRKKKVK